jgi:hypothetical protein
MNRTRIIAVIGLALALSACASALPNPETTTPDQIGGFWWGLWNGWTAGFSFIGSLFSDNIAIYHTPNNGGWYDFGFVLGIGVFSFGVGKAKR